MINSKNIEKSKMFIIRNEILKLFINRNTKFNYLYISNHFDYQLYQISWAENCFSELEFFNYNNPNQNILEELAKVSKSIKKFIICLKGNDNSGIVRLIEAQKNLSEVHIFRYSYLDDESLETVEKSLIKNAASIQNLTIGWKPIITKFLLYFVNLKSLVINDNMMVENYSDCWHMSLPVLKDLRTKSILPNFLVRLIENTSGHLTTISIFYEVILCRDVDIRRLIQAIYQNCPNLRYLKIPIKNCNLPEFEKLLTNCQDLNGLIILDERSLNYEELFNILTESSPKGLFKFKFIFNRKYGNKLVSLKSIFDNWKDRKPILLQIDLVNCFTQQEEQEMMDLIEKYKAKEIIKRFDLNIYDNVKEEFEWVQEQSYSQP